MSLALGPGRSCPLHYRYSPSALNRPADIEAETLYVVGGLYGNRPALDSVLEMAAIEPGGASLVFNGDFNWFDVDREGFAAINAEVLRHTALRGNVETELASDEAGAGCGCAYPESVSQADVDRSNAIAERLRETARRFPDLRARLGRLPMHLRAQVGKLRIGVVHGDAESLAGWSFDVQALERADAPARIGAMFAAAGVDVFASSHTCLPVMRSFQVVGERWIANNGAAGMPNFQGTEYGLLTRVSVRPAPRGVSLYGTRLKDGFIDTMPIRYDQQGWMREFLANWPAGSPAHTSYYARISAGPTHDLERAFPGRAASALRCAAY